MGGANLTNLACLNKTLLLKWVIRLKNEVETAWKDYFLNHQRIPSLNITLECNLAPKDSHQLLRGCNSPVWEDIIYYWCEYNFDQNIYNFPKVLEQTIWLNSHIRIGGVPVVLDSWLRAGIVYVKDLVVEGDNRIMSYTECIVKYQVKGNFLEYCSIIDAIPPPWRKLIREGLGMLDKSTEHSEHLIESFQNYDHKKLYGILNTQSCDIPDERFESWDKEFNLREFLCSELEWTENFKYCFLWTKSTELRSFEYSFRMRILLTNNRLHKMGLVESMRCSRCQAEVEDLKHAFWTCLDVGRLWQNVLYWVHKTFNIDIKDDPRTCLFSLLDDTGLEVANVIWLCLLLCKRYIWQARCNQIPLYIDGCLQKIRDIEKLESMNATKAEKVNRHERKWGFSIQPSGGSG